jgi:gamma-glutamylcyclotransferase (GGCT)/AIG2-like uncharacterized protein YtfP
MNRVFVFATLKAKGIREQALGADAYAVRVERATVRDFYEVFIARGTERWPTLLPSLGDETEGDVLFVDDYDLSRLDAWETRYQRRPIVTDEFGLAWAYFLKD